MQHAVEEAETPEPPKSRSVGATRPDGGCEGSLEKALLGQDPAHDAGGAATAFRNADAERVLGLGKSGFRGNQAAERQREPQAGNQEAAPAQGQATMTLLASLMPKSTPGDMLAKKASDSF